MKCTLDQFYMANKMEFVVSFIFYGECNQQHYVTGVSEVLDTLCSWVQNSVTLETLIKMFVFEKRKKYSISKGKMV